ncbi:MAG: hypothetical protein ACOYNL_08820 [Rickettsiales bacterium]
MNTQPHPQNSWINALMTRNRPTLSALKEDFSRLASNIFGVSITEDNLESAEIADVSAERYQQIMNGLDPEVQYRDVLDYNAETKSLIIAAATLKEMLNEWMVEHLPLLFSREHSFQLDGHGIRMQESSMLMLLHHYQKHGLINPEVKLPVTEKALHEKLDSMFQDTMKIYTPPTASLPKR